MSTQKPISTDKKQQLGINSTIIFGRVDENSKYYDVRDEVGRKILDYRLIKIRCQLKSNDSIYGIQFIYRNINTSQEFTLINVEPNDPDLIDQEMELSLEQIIDLRAWVSETIKLIGFEITTNRGKSQKFGYGNDEELRMCPEFENKDQAVIGFGVIADEKHGVTGLYAYYLRRKTYAFYLYSGMFCLRIKIRNEENKKKIESKIKDMDEIYKILFNVCSLPDNQFFNIVKYTII